MGDQKGISYLSAAGRWSFMSFVSLGFFLPVTVVCAGKTLLRDGGLYASNECKKWVLMRKKALN
jgi:hypothetical protein